MNQPPFDRRGFVAALLGNTLLFGALQSAAAAPSRRLPPVVTREQPSGAFKVAQPGSPAVRVTFLTPTMLRVTILAAAPATPRLPDYVRVKTSSSYAPVDVDVYPENDEVTFKTTDAIFN